MDKYSVGGTGLWIIPMHCFINLEKYFPLRKRISVIQKIKLTIRFSQNLYFGLVNNNSLVTGEQYKQTFKLKGRKLEKLC